ncbi:hypothetical protein K370107A2_18890 [Merdimmobilis hominis]
MADIHRSTYYSTALAAALSRKTRDFGGISSPWGKRGENGWRQGSNAGEFSEKIPKTNGEKWKNRQIPHLGVTIMDYTNCNKYN